MDRRTFVTWVGAGIIAPLAWRQASPTSSPPAGARPDPIDLGNGITLIDYRLHPGEHPSIIGEIQNETDHMIDAPVVSLTYPRKELSDGFTWASPIIPVVEADGSVPIFGPLPDDADPEIILQTATFALCSPAEPGDFTKYQKEVEDVLVVMKTSERIEETVYTLQGSISNEWRKPIPNISLQGIVRDSSHRIAGTTSGPYWTRLDPNTPKDFSIWAGGGSRQKADPFSLLEGTDYTVEIIVGTRGPVASPGCTFGKPWD